MWFFIRIAWWLAVFVLLSIGAGIMALVRLARPGPDESAAFGQYSDDGRLWQDRATGQWYPCSQTERERCEVEATEAGFYWRRTAISRLMRAGAVLRYRFCAVGGGSSAADPVLIAEVEFPVEARRNITLDHLDPANASTDPYNLGVNRDSAKSALDDLDWLLAMKGWKRLDDETSRKEHWYGRVYERPAVQWSKPVEPPAQAPSLPDGSAGRPVGGSAE
jgi:hypothetical protein